MKMRKTVCFWALPLVLLCACGAPADAEPVWGQELPGSGVYMEMSGAELLSDEPIKYAPSREEASNRREYPALQVDGVPVITLHGVEPDQVELRFSENIDNLYLYYDKVLPQPELDYVQSRREDGALQYRLDTVYNYEFIITTPQGSDDMMVICYRDGLRDVPAALAEEME